ncbi:MAG TPA: hypothetical protein VK927_03895, partial [Adhaeribacter sp.]|nr:hypothetical protein [Adhaeribacter sp.]
FVHTWYKPEGNLSPEQISTTLSNMLLNGIVSGQKSEPTPNLPHSSGQALQEGNKKTAVRDLRSIHQN